METKPITCPLTGHLQVVNIEYTALGILVVSCSGFPGSGCVACNTECARRMDRRDRLRASDGTERVLVVLDDADLAADGERLATALREDEWIVDLAHGEVAALPPPQDYEAVCFVTAALRRKTRSIGYARLYREALGQMPAWVATTDQGGSMTATPLFADRSYVPVQGVVPIARAIGDCVSELESGGEDLAR